MKAERTRQYYKHLKDEDICDCAYCRNYVKEIKSSYPDLSDYLQTMGVDIEKPFETIPIAPENGIMFYSGAQYIVIGLDDDFKETLVGDVRIFVTDSHPMTDVEEKHFVIELSPIYLKWVEDELRGV